MLEPTQIIEMTIYSKIISEFSTKITQDARLVIGLMILYGIYKYMPESYYNKFFEYLFSQDESFIVIPSHRKIYHVHGYNTKEIIKMKYSPRFKALHHYLLHTCKVQFQHLYEIMEIIDNCKDYSHTEIEEYILMPYQNRKVKICDVCNIYLEITVSTNTDDEKDEKNKKTAQSYKQYLCKLSTPGLNSNIINDFLTECIETHKKFLNKTTNKQYIFEYSKTEFDDNDKKVAKYTETPFKSNKHLSTNIFFPEKPVFMQQLNKFIHEREKHQKDYEESGQTYKLTVMIYGKPGTGKTSIIRGMLNETGRDGVLISWADLKTCGDLASILRSNKFNGKHKELKDLIFIFEDFDANHSQVLKARKQNNTKIRKSRISDDEDSFSQEDDLEIIANKLTSTANVVDTPKEILEQIKSLKTYAANVMSVSNKPIEDELTMERVLTMFDGVVEHHDAIIVFTTNHLEDIDPAIIRPGRVDYMLELKNATVETIKEMVRNRYKLTEEDESKYHEKYLLLEDYKLSPAEVQNQCFTNESVEECLGKLISLCKI